MIKEALLKASVPITLMTLALILGLAPLYLLAGILARSSSTTSPSPVSHPQSVK